VVAFCVGYRRILESFRPLAAKGAKAAAIFDGGCREAGILLNGPNCMGVLNPATRSSIYIQELRDPAGLVGNVGLISQSGSNGIRGGPPADIASLARCLYALGDFAFADRAHIAEIDLNPIKVRPLGQGCIVVDALIVPIQAGTE